MHSGGMFSENLSMIHGMFEKLLFLVVIVIVYEGASQGML